MYLLSPEFKDAVTDYSYLLEKGYPRKSMLKLVGDRYQLRSVERSMLYRGVCSTSEMLLRQQKTLRLLHAPADLSIDGYNVIRTIGSYLSGKQVFISMDGFLRDAAEMHSSVLKEGLLDRIINLIFSYLKKQKIKSLKVFLDRPISKSGELAHLINRRLPEESISGSAQTEYSPDHHLKDIKAGVISTSDSAIIDNSQVKVFDLAKAVIEYHFSPDFLFLGEMLEKPVEKPPGR
jgi:hypothetical protein